MAAPSTWNPERDALLLLMTSQGASDRTIAAELHIAAETVRARPGQLNIAAGGADWWTARSLKEDRPRNDAPLPAGHPLSWGAITAETSMAGSAYPVRP